MAQVTTSPNSACIYYSLTAIFLYEDPKELQIMKPYSSFGHPLHLCAPAQEGCAGSKSSIQHCPPRSNCSMSFRRGRDGARHIRRLDGAFQRGGNPALRQRCQLATIVGGPSPTRASSSISTQADFVVLGEGEITSGRAAPCCCTETRMQSLDGIAELAFRPRLAAASSGRNHGRDSRHQCTAWPAREAIDMDRYVSVCANITAPARSH